MLFGDFYHGLIELAPIQERHFGPLQDFVVAAAGFHQDQHFHLHRFFHPHISNCTGFSRKNACFLRKIDGFL